MAKQAVILLAHGSPDSATEVPEFLRSITRGRPLSPEVVQEVQQRYEQIGRSPLRQHTETQARLVQQRLGVPVYVGMRNWKPLIADAAKNMAQDGIERVAAICMAPQNSRTSVGLYKQALLSALASPIEVNFVESWHDHPLLIAAFAEKLRSAWSAMRAALGRDFPVVFTAHSVPVKTLEEGDPYERQARQTAALVAARVPEIREWRFSLQSQGMSGGQWLGPRVEETLEALREAGHTAALVQPIGFLCDHVEVLYDIDIGFREFARQRGIELRRTESLNDSPLLADAIAAIARETLAGLPTAAAAGRG